MAETACKSDPADAILQWLAADPDDDLASELDDARAHFAAFANPAGAAGLAQDSAAVLEQFAARALDVCGRLRPLLLNAALPLPRELHVVAGGLVELLCEVASAFRRVEARREPRWLRLNRPAGEMAAAQAFVLLSEAYTVLAMSGAPVPDGFWRMAHACGGMATGNALEGEAAAQRLFLYRRMLSVAVAQPESLTPRESSWLFDYLDSSAMLAQLSHAPIEPSAAAYWIDLSGDAQPVATSRRPPPAAPTLCYFSPAPLVQRAREHIERLETRLMNTELSSLELDGELLVPDVLDLPLGLTPAEILSLLRRLRDRWAMPLVREQPRRQHRYTVQVCVGLRAVWELGRRELGRRALGRGALEAARVAEWMVLNESPGGYAIMSVSGAEGSVSAGVVVALRRDAAEPWAVCIVRWVRSDDPNRLELGLQMMSLSFASILLGFRGSEVRAAVPGLMLPAMPPVRRNAVILAPTGTCTSRRFVFVREGPSLYVAQGRALGLDMQTASVEMFQFETDPYAL